MGERGNKDGVHYALTVFAPVTPGHETAAREAIDALAWGEASPLARLEQLHYSRLQIFDHLVHPGPKVKPDHLTTNYMVFTATISGDAEAFLDAICERLPAEADSWWSHCIGYPGTSDRIAFKRYMRAHQLLSSSFASSFQGSVPEVLESLDARRRVVDFAIAAQGLDAEELHRRFYATFGEGQS